MGITPVQEVKTGSTTPLPEVIDTKGKGQQPNCIHTEAKTSSTTPQPKVVDTKVEGDLNNTAVQVTGQQPNSIYTQVKGDGNTTIVTVNNNNYNKPYGSSAGTVTHGTNAAGPNKAKPAQTPQPAQKKPEPKKTPETKTEAKPVPSQPPMSIRETEQRAKELAHASNGPGTDEEAFYNAVTTVPGGETEESARPGDIKTMAKRVFLSKDNLIKLDKYLKQNQLATVPNPGSPMRSAGGLRSYIYSEFKLTNRNGFYDPKMLELVNLLDEYKIK